MVTRVAAFLPAVEESDEHFKSEILHGFIATTNDRLASANTPSTQEGVFLFGMPPSAHS